MPSILLDDVDLYYETHGDGSPLMLVAGLASDSQSWQPILGELARRHHVITPDNRGVGRTSPQDVATSIHRIADDCIALARHLGLSSFNLLGHSMGGFVALDLAIRYPEQVDKLILAATSSVSSKRNAALFSDWSSGLEAGMDAPLWWRGVFYWLFSTHFFDDDAAVRDAVRFAIEYPYPQTPLAFRHQIEAIDHFDCTRDLARIAAKTLVLSGSEDLLFPAAVGARLAQSIPRADFSVIAGAAHSIHMEQPVAFTNHVLEFLGGD